MSANPWVGCGPEGVLHYCSYCNHDVDDRTPAQDLAAAQKRIEELEGELETARYREANLRSQWPQILKDGQRYITEANEEFAKRKTAEGRIAELEAQVAQHPEQLRRVAEAVDAARLRQLGGESELPPLDLADIIAEATKP